MTSQTTHDFRLSTLAIQPTDFRLRDNLTHTANRQDDLFGRDNLTHMAHVRSDLFADDNLTHTANAHMFGRRRIPHGTHAARRSAHADRIKLDAAG